MINTDEYGNTIYVDMHENVSGATEYKLILQPAVGAEVEKDGALGVAYVKVDGVEYFPNEYLTCVVGDGDITESGLWRKRGEAQMTTERRSISDWQRFTVG